MLKVHKDAERPEDKTVIFLDVPKELRAFIHEREPYSIQHGYNVIEEALDYLENAEWYGGAPKKTLQDWLFARAGEWNKIAGR